MSKLMKFTFKLLDLIVIFVMTFTMPVGVLAAPPAQAPAPAIMTDKTDYLPGETVNVSGLEFAAGNYFLDAALKAPINNFPRSRELLDDLVEWHGL